MGVKQYLSVMTAAGVLVHTSGMALAFDPFGREITRRNQEEIDRNAAEIARNWALIRALKEEQRLSTIPKRRQVQRSVPEVPPAPPPKPQTEVASSSWQNLAVAAALVGGVWWWLSSDSAPATGSGMAASDSSNNGDSWLEEYLSHERKKEHSSPSTPAWQDPGAGYFWGNPIDGTVPKSLWGTTKEE